jgi:hypothetical protein
MWSLRVPIDSLLRTSLATFFLFGFGEIITAAKECNYLHKKWLKTILKVPTYMGHGMPVHKQWSVLDLSI